MTTERPTIPAARPVFPERDIPDILADIRAVLEGGRLILGPHARALEAEWAQRLGVPAAVAMGSCTAALETAYRHARVRGRDVIVPTNTFVATAVAALNAGARVVLADMDPRDYCVDVDDVRRRITDRTAAVVVVHVAGFVPHGVLDLIDECRTRGIATIEDCAHAHGAAIGGRPAGSLADAGCFSFYPTKILTSATGGLLATRDPDLDAFARSLRHHGQGESLERVVNLGNDWLLDEVRAVLARWQLRRLDEFLARRREVAAAYRRLLADRSDVTLPEPAPGVEPAYYKFPVTLADGIDARRVRERLGREHGIEVGALYYPPCHRMPALQRDDRVVADGLDRADAILPRQICLPMHAALRAGDPERIVEALDAVLRTET